MHIRSIGITYLTIFPYGIIHSVLTHQGKNSQYNAATLSSAETELIPYNFGTIYQRLLFLFLNYSLISSIIIPIWVMSFTLVRQNPVEYSLGGWCLYDGGLYGETYMTCTVHVYQRNKCTLIKINYAILFCFLYNIVNTFCYIKIQGLKLNMIYE